MVDGHAVVAQLGGERDERLGRAAQRLQVHDLRPDVDVQADYLKSLLRANAAGQLTDITDGDAKFVALQAGRDMGMAPGVDVRVDTQGDAGAGLLFARDAIDALQLSGRLGVDGLHAEIDGLRQLGIRFPDAGKDYLRRNEPGPQGDVDFPPGVRVRAGTEAAQQAGNGERGVGLERIVDGVWIRTKRIVHRAVARGDGRAAVNVKGGPMAFGELSDRRAVAQQRSVLAMKSRHDARRSDCSRPDVSVACWHSL